MPPRSRIWRPPEALAVWLGPGGAFRLADEAGGCRAALDRDIAAIDALIGEPARRDPAPSAAAPPRGSWRGLAWLVDGLGSDRAKVKLLNISWRELCRDLERAAEFDQSQLFRKVYEDEFGTPGGEPYGLLVVDHEVRHRPAPGAPTDDVTALAQLAGVAAAAFVPTVLAASPALLQVDEFADLAMAPDLSDPFRAPEFTRWRGLSGARGHALHRGNPAAPAGAPALGGRSRAASMGSATPNMPPTFPPGSG